MAVMPEGSIVGGWIAPHGVVSDMPEERLRLVPETDRAMRLAAREIVRRDPEAVILIAPHGFRAADANTVSLCYRNACELRTWYPWRSDEMVVPGDPELGQAILTEAAVSDIPALGLIYGATSEPVYPMDWSITAPLSYLLNAGYTGSLIPVTFSQLPFRQEWRFGEALARAIGTSGHRIAVVASSDLSHVHSAEGPYGQKPIAAHFDRFIEETVRSGNLERLLGADPAWVDEAAQDGLRSIAILGGALQSTRLRLEVLAYEVLVYFGMLTALAIERGPVGIT